MARDLTAGMQAEVAAATLRPVMFYEGEFTGGTIRLWSGLGSISWNGQTWTGAGLLMGMNEVTETADLRAAGIQVSLSGVPSAMLAAALTNSFSGAAGSVWLGMMDASGAIVADPYLAFEGKLDVPTLTDDGNACTISITYENHLIDLERPRVRRWTAEDQHIDYPADEGFAYMVIMQDQVIEW